MRKDFNYKLYYLVGIIYFAITGPIFLYYGINEIVSLSALFAGYLPLTMIFTGIATMISVKRVSKC